MYFQLVDNLKAKCFQPQGQPDVLFNLHLRLTAGATALAAARRGGCRWRPQPPGRDAQPALVIGRHYVTERDSAPVQYNGVV